MTNTVFLCKDKRLPYDRDSVCYIDLDDLTQDIHKSNNLYSLPRPSIHGACYTGGMAFIKPYKYLTTVLTKQEWDRLLEFDKAVFEMCCSTITNEMRRQYVCLRGGIQDIIDKLKSDKNQKVFKKVIKAEIKYIKEEYNLSDEDVQYIFDNYPLEYRDQGIIGMVYDSVKDCGVEVVESFLDIPEQLFRYIDFEGYGNDIILDDNSYIKLEDGRVVYYRQ